LKQTFLAKATPSFLSDHHSPWSSPTSASATRATQSSSPSPSSPQSTSSHQAQDSACPVCHSSPSAKTLYVARWQGPTCTIARCSSNARLLSRKSDLLPRISRRMYYYHCRARLLPATFSFAEQKGHTVCTYHLLLFGLHLLNLHRRGLLPSFFPVPPRGRASGYHWGWRQVDMRSLTSCLKARLRDLLIRHQW